MTMRNAKWTAALGPAIMALVLCTGLLFAGCGGEEPAPPAPAPQAQKAPAPEAAPVPVPAPAEEAPSAPQPAPEAAPAAAPAPKTADAGAVAPVTLEVLQLIPAGSQVALALPPLNALLEKVLPIAGRFAPDGVDLKEGLAEIVTDLAIDAGVPDAESIGDIALGKGLNLDKPLAVFVDASKSAESAAEAMEEATKAEEGSEAKEEGSEAAEEAPASMPEIDPEDLEVPAIVAVLGVSDQEKAVATLKEIIAEVDELSGLEPQEVKEAGMAITVYGDYGYFFAGDKLAVGTLDLLKGVAARVAQPAAIRYGSTDCPAEFPDEVVMLGYMERMLPLLELVMQAMPDMEQYATMMEMQLGVLEDMVSEGDADDPSVITLGLSNEKLELKSRMDQTTHPGVAKASGPAQPLRFAPLLPDSTLAFLSIRLNDEMKTQIKDVYLQGLPAELTESAEFAQGMTIANQVLEMLGDEVTLGVAGAEEDLPSAVLMVSLANPEPTKGLLQMLVPTMPGETHNDVEISTIAAPIPVPLSIAFLDDVLLAANDTDKMKAIIDMLKEKKQSKLFASLEPPLDTAVPRFNALLVNTSLLTDVVVPMAALAGGLPPDLEPVFDEVGAELREVRMLAEIDGSWQVSRLSVYLKDAS